MSTMIVMWGYQTYKIHSTAILKVHDNLINKKVLCNLSVTHLDRLKIMETVMELAPGHSIVLNCMNKVQFCSRSNFRKRKLTTKTHTQQNHGCEKTVSENEPTVDLFLDK